MCMMLLKKPVCSNNFMVVHNTFLDFFVQSDVAGEVLKIIYEDGGTNQDPFTRIHLYLIIRKTLVVLAICWLDLSC